jgi:hypothetical protein
VGTNHRHTAQSNSRPGPRVRAGALRMLAAAAVGVGVHGGRPLPPGGGGGGGSAALRGLLAATHNVRGVRVRWGGFGGGRRKAATAPITYQTLRVLAAMASPRLTPSCARTLINAVCVVATTAHVRTVLARRTVTRRLTSVTSATVIALPAA